MVMTNAVVNPEQTLLLDVLKATVQNQELRPILEQNVDKLNQNFVAVLREWATERFTKEPSRAANLAKVLVKFCKQLQQFEQGNIVFNLDIAIAGYEVAMSVFSIEAFPLERGGIQSCLNSALKQRGEILAAQSSASDEAQNSRTAVKSEVVTVQNEKQSKVEPLPQDLQEASASVQNIKKSTDDLSNQNGRAKHIQDTIINHENLNQVQTIQPEIQKENLHQEELDNKIITPKKTKQSNNDKLEEQNDNYASLLVEFQELKQRQSILEQLLTKVNASPTSDKFNTAIFYDIENLTRGRQHPHVKDFSLREIKKKIAKNPVVNKIAIQCAYADWSNTALRHIKREIQELGIETAQIFGLGFERNAADIQLAIDVMELIHSHPTLQVFVIVSGDGAFASLAKKLHEYGKTVIACGYEGQVNRVLKSVCDEFISIPNIQENAETVNIEQDNHNSNGNGNAKAHLASL